MLKHIQGRFSKATLLAAGLLACGAPAYAADSGDPMIEGAKLCTHYMPRFEREYAIPTHLLSAIASTESGRYHDGLKLSLPWPWTINAEGKGYYFGTKEEAIAAVRKLKARGVNSIDVGCMQVNLYHHPQAFSSIEQAFEPQYNIAYAASFLRNLYEEDKSWKQASADYHSKTPGLDKEYVGQVYSRWYQIIDKLRAAKLQVPESAIAALNDTTPLTASPGDNKPAGLIKVAAKTKTPAVRTITRLPEQVGKKVADYKSPRMNSIKVTTQRDTTKENGIIVVRPEIKVVDNAPMKVAEVKTTPVNLPDGQIIRVEGHREINNAASRRSGPNFIFND